MAEEKKKKKKKVKAERQAWNPHWTLQLLHKLWMAAFATAKIAIGAVATVAMICVICVIVFAGILGDYLENDVLPQSGMVLEDYGQAQSSHAYYYDESGNIQLLQNLYGSRSSWATLEEMPEDLINATIAIEDKRFYEHQGVDWFTTIKACAGMFLGGSSGGGSTVTQQLVKNLTGENSVTVQRKVLEWFRAAALEKNYDKDVILEHYLNRIYLGQGCYGVKSAAAVYFGKELEMLTAAECASLISITNNPSLFDPYGKVFEYRGEELSGAERNRLRQVDTLWSMRNQELLTEEEYQEAYNQEMVFKNGIADEDRMTTCPNTDCGYRNIAKEFTNDKGKGVCPQCGSAVDLIKNASQTIYSDFLDIALEDVARALAEKDGAVWNETTKNAYEQLIGIKGLHIYTTLDMRVQNQIDKIYEDLDQIPTARSAQQLQSAIVVVDNRTGYIVGLKGGVGEKTVHDAYNRAKARLQTGSSIKPLSVYAPAFEAEIISPASAVKDMPLEIKPTAFPRNDSKTYAYARTIYSALINSINASAVDVLDQLGLKESFTFAKEKFRLTSLIEEYTAGNGRDMSDIGYAPLALGAQTFGVTVREMATAFATFANKGTFREGITFTKVYDSEGNLILDNEQETEKILSSKTIDYVNYCLQNAVSAGTGTAAKISGQNVAGKTGTTGDNKDRWFCGYTGYYTAAVWCGYDIPEEIKLTGTKTNPAARLFKKVMEPLHKGLEKVSLYSSSKMKSVTICVDSGLLATDACKTDIRTGGSFDRVDQVRAYKEDFPTKFCDQHVTVDYCTEGEGVANEFCHLFAEAEVIKLKKTSLLKRTQEQIDEIWETKKFKILDSFLRDDYIYLVDEEGNDAEWHGFDGKINKNVKAPYKVCTVHTQETWDAYLQSIAPPPTEPPATEDPAMPGMPAMPVG